MARGRKSDRPSTASSPEARENQIIAMAYDLAEKQIREGTASAQVLAHFLRLGSTKDRLERDVLSEKKKLMSAKTESIESQKNADQMYKEALRAMKRYSGNGSVDDDEEDY